MPCRFNVGCTFWLYHINFYSWITEYSTSLFFCVCRYDLIIGVVRSEAYFTLTAEDAQYGIEADRRTKILREFVRNTYTYHQAEILATIINEYTDWEKAVQHPVNIRYRIYFIRASGFQLLYIYIQGVSQLLEKIDQWIERPKLRRNALWDFFVRSKLAD